VFFGRTRCLIQATFISLIAWSFLALRRVPIQLSYLLLSSFRLVAFGRLNHSTPTRWPAFRCRASSHYSSCADTPVKVSFSLLSSESARCRQQALSVRRGSRSCSSYTFRWTGWFGGCSCPVALGPVARGFPRGGTTFFHSTSANCTGAGLLPNRFVSCWFSSNAQTLAFRLHGQASAWSDSSWIDWLSGRVQFSGTTSFVWRCRPVGHPPSSSFFLGRVLCFFPPKAPRLFLFCSS